MASVKVYSTHACPWCIKAKMFFKEHNIEFEDIDVTSNQDAAREMVEKSGQTGVPVIIIDDNVIVGFNRDRIMELLDIEE